MIIIDCSGMLCPRPLIEAKKAYSQASIGDNLTIIVDNETAANNLNTYFAGNGIGSTTSLEGNKFKIAVSKQEASQSAIATSKPEEFCTPLKKSDSTPMVIAISSNKMGEGDAQLGTILMKGFFAALSESDSIPSEIIFYNSGVLLLLQDSGIIPSLEILKSLGVKITACGTCTDFYAIKDKISIGTISNMFSILASLSSASKVIKP